jgi:L-iditol 2-dehydrogenase
LCNVEKMKAAVITGLNLLEVKDVPIPRIEPQSVLIKVHSCAVCGSDIRIFETGNPRVKYPAIIGHEISGEIIEIGEGVNRFKVGDQIALGADVPCGRCFWCLNGMGNCCDENYAIGYQFQGGFAEKCLIKPMAVQYGPISIVPDGVDMEQAAIAEPLGCCINGMERVSFKAGKSVLIIGAGPIGLLLAQTARVFGSSLTILYDKDPQRLRNSHIGKPDYVIDSKADLVKEIKARTEGKGVDIVFVACASPEAQMQSLGVVAKRGVINFFGGLPKTAGNISINSNDVHYKEASLTGSHGSTPVHHAMAMKLIAAGRIEVSQLITHRYSLDDIALAFETVKKRLGLKVIVQP